VSDSACSVLGRTETEEDDSKVVVEEVEGTGVTSTKLACSTLRLARFLLRFELLDLPPSAVGPPFAVGVCDDVVDADWAVAAAAAAAAADWAAEDVDGDEEDIVVGFDRFDSDITLFAAVISAVSSTRTVQGGDA
jgi:hypothetical protein